MPPRQDPKLHGAKTGMNITAASKRRQELAVTHRTKRRHATLNNLRGVTSTITVGVETRLRDGHGRAVMAKDLKRGDSLLCSKGRCIKITAVKNCSVRLHKVTPGSYSHLPRKGKKAQLYAHLESMSLAGEVEISMRINSKPYPCTSGTLYQVVHWKLDASGLPQWTRVTYRTAALRDKALAKMKRLSTPCDYKCTIDTFCNVFGRYLRSQSFMSLAPPTKPQQLGESLRSRIRRIFKVGRVSRSFFETLLHDTAWLLGLWLADGETLRSVIGQIGTNINDHEKSHMPVLDAIQSWMERVNKITPQEAKAIIVRKSRVQENSNIFHKVNCGPLFLKLLKSYGFTFRKNTKKVPEELLSDELEVRRHLLCGIVDGDGCKGTTHWVIAVKPKPLAKGFMELAQGLGLATSKVRKGHGTKQLTIRGSELAKFKTRLLYKRCSGTDKMLVGVPIQVKKAREGPAVELTLERLPRGSTVMTADYLKIR
jgi:hypothetical protein